MKLRVALAPVAIRSRQAKQPAEMLGLVTRGADEAWPSVALERSGIDPPDDRRLLELLPPSGRVLLESLGASPRPVTFIRDGATLTLLYTVAVPSPLVDASLVGDVTTDAPLPEGEDASGTGAGVWEGMQWRRLVRPHAYRKEAMALGTRGLATLPHGEIVVDFWRQRLEERAAFVEFLPRYVTNPQVRDLYSAVWGYEQDPPAFSRWSGLGDIAGPKGRKGDGSSALAPFVTQVPDDVRAEVRIREEIREQFAAKLAALQTTGAGVSREIDPTDEELLTAVAFDYSVHGFDLTETLKSERIFPLLNAGASAAMGVRSARGVAGAAAVGGLGVAMPVAAPAGVLALAATAAVVAYRKRSRGARPTWFCVRDNVNPEVRLSSLYLPRPAWNQLPSSPG
ncbi:MAG: hypothetical protein KAG80_12715 [Nocardioides sp.]|nr:hypothetical protein [Nocardioides sp.]